MPEPTSFARRPAGRRVGVALHRFAVATASTTLLLIVAGGLVTSTESGLSVPDWPTTYGSNMWTFPVSKWVGGIRYEHTHRLIASFVGLLTIILAGWLARREPRRWVRRLGYGALAAVVAQGVLGGMTVLFLLPTWISVCHACLAQIFFCLTVAIAVVTSPRWAETTPADVRAAISRNPVARMTLATAAVIFLQLVIGAIMRHTKAGLAIPDFPLAFGKLVPPLRSFPVAIHFAHRVVGLTVAVLVAICAVRAFRTRPRRDGLRKAAAWLCAVAATQIALGAATVLSGRSVGFTTAHVAMGAVLMAGTLVLGLSSLAAEGRKNNVVPIRRTTLRASGWK
ncbi:MAG TPA: COX15/CtaA family protein [Thermoanaerobaculia bacterium]|jgi:cytochrome c oxidase assembly protein subunit 15